MYCIELLFHKLVATVTFLVVSLLVAQYFLSYRTGEQYRSRENKNSFRHSKMFMMYTTCRL